MLKLSVQIWLVANLAVFAVFCLSLVPGTGFTALLYSAVFSLPAILILYWLLRFLRHVREHRWFSWLVLLAGTGAGSLVAFALFRLAFPSLAGEAGFVLPLSLISGYSSVVLFSSSLQSLFLKFQYGND